MLPTDLGASPRLAEPRGELMRARRGHSMTASWVATLEVVQPFDKLDVAQLLNPQAAPIGD